MVSFLAKVKFFRFWPKTMDYNKAFLPKLRYINIHIYKLSYIPVPCTVCNRYSVASSAVWLIQLPSPRARHCISIDTILPFRDWKRSQLSPFHADTPRYVVGVGWWASIGKSTRKYYT